MTAIQHNENPYPPQDWNLNTFKVLMDERFESLNKAMLLQAVEYERRLNELNHEQTRVSEIQRIYLTQDKYEDYIKSHQQWAEQMKVEWHRRIDSVKNDIADIQDLFLKQSVFDTFVRSYEDKHHILLDQLHQDVERLGERLTDEVKPLNEFKQEYEGKSHGIHMTLGAIIGTTALISTVVGIVFVIFHLIGEL